jgi:hypothetical protein
MKLEFSLNTSEIRAKLGKITSQETRRDILQAVGADIHGRVQEHIGDMSVSRHKTADRLGAGRTGYYEQARGRVVLREVTPERATVVIENTPGLSRAYHDLHIQPVRARWLTIPIHRDAYAMRVADLRGMGHKIFRPGKARILAETGKLVEVMVYGDGAFKDPIGKIWELADPVVSPAYTAGLEGTPNELKLKYLADNDFADLSGEALKEAIKAKITTKDSDLFGQMASEGTTPRRLTDLIGSLCDLTSGSGDKGTPIVHIQGYFDNYTTE